MTGLPNRIVLYDRLNQSIIKNKRRQAGSSGIILLQIDRYETMREAYGQAFCDMVGKGVAQRLMTTLRTTDTLTIMAENTMCILVDMMRDDTDLVRVARRVRQAAEEPLSMGEESVVLTLSIGMAQAQPHHDGADELIKDATAALNKARIEGGGHEVVFDPECSAAPAIGCGSRRTCIWRCGAKSFCCSISRSWTCRPAPWLASRPGPVAASDARHGLAARFHSHGGRNRPDRPDRDLGSAGIPPSVESWMKAAPGRNLRQCQRLQPAA